MSTNNIDYQKAVDTLDNTYPPAKGFVDSSVIKSETDKLLCAQNNTIIELLTRVNQKLDTLIQIQTTSTKPTPEFTNILDKINNNLASFSLDNSKKIIKSADQKIVVWKDPTTLFPKKT